jgi:hypothetical protein
MTVRARPIPRPRRWVSYLAVIALALTGVACDRGGTSVEDDPEQALREALEELADYEGIELLVQLSADDTAQAQALREEDLTEEELELLLTASVLVRATGGDDDGRAEFIVTLDDEAVAELRVLPDTDVYLRLDLERLIDLVDDPEASTQLDELAVQAEAFGLREAVEAARAGDWIRVTGVEQMLNLFGGSPAPAEEVDEDEAERLAEELSAAAVRFLDRDVDVTYVGSDDAGERVRATTDGASLRAFLEDVNRIVASADALGGTDPQDLAGDLGDLPDDATVSLDAWLQDGRLTQLALDLAALDDDGTTEGELLLVVGVAEFTGSVDAPDEAVVVDLFGLLGGFLGGFGGGTQDAFGDDAGDGFDDDAFDDDAFDEEFGADDCLSEEELDQMRSFLEPEEQAELDEAIEMGIIPVC